MTAVLRFLMVLLQMNNGETRIEFRGTTWRVLNSGEEAIPAGGRAIIERTEGLTLHVRATD